MKDLASYKNIYFLGVGGIGMSALARYFNTKKFLVGGYDKTSSNLTNTLEKEGILCHFEDLAANIPEPFNSKDDTLVIYTPAVPTNLGELLFLQENNFDLLKRSQVLGILTKNSKGLAVAGTHGKTTTSTLLTHILSESPLKCNAFLGGISSNFESNFVGSSSSEFTVIEADEFDRSFLQLHPFASIITSTDSDHLDIYGDAKTFLEGFQLYANQIDPDGFLILQKDLNLKANCKIYTYSINQDADFSASNLRSEKGKFFMDVFADSFSYKKVELGLPGTHNAENALACIALGHILGLSENEIRHGLKTFKGVKRRFEFHIREEKLVFIDDYAHHPTELKALIDSVKLIFPNKRIKGIFQPHLFSRTRDFIDDFATQLSRLDELILLPIYPAREEAIEGISSEFLLSKCQNAQKGVFSAQEIVDSISVKENEVLLTIGAGDIDRIVPQIAKILSRK
jgi:UDP-N-acetylmuramate--alanine ligase